MKHLLLFESFIEYNDDFDYGGYDNLLNKLLSEKNIKFKFSDDTGNMNILLDNKIIGKIRYREYDNYINMENIELEKKYIGKGLGFFIYESLYLTSKEFGMKGILSLQYNEDIGQKRSEYATKVLRKLISKYGGEVHDLKNWGEVGDEDFLITGTGKIEKKIV